jgi:hypothetical protein
MLTGLLYIIKSRSKVAKHLTNTLEATSIRLSTGTKTRVSPPFLDVLHYFTF